jgi:hypothetical protein
VLGQQKVDPDDSLFGRSAGLVNVAGNGLADTTYQDLIARAFHDEYHRAGPAQMQANFSLFWGLAVMQYEALLISDQTRFDSDELTTQEQLGKELFTGRAKCVSCHHGPLLSAATVTQASLTQVVEFFNRGDDRQEFGHDADSTGSADLQILSASGLPDKSNLDDAIGDNSKRSGGLGLSPEERAALVAFLKSLTDDRVACHAGPFDHPELPISMGQSSDADGNGTRAPDIMASLPATGRMGLSAVLDQAGRKLPCFPNSGDLFGETQTVLQKILARTGVAPASNGTGTGTTSGTTSASAGGFSPLPGSGAGATQAATATEQTQPRGAGTTSTSPSTSPPSGARRPVPSKRPVAAEKKPVPPPPASETATAPATSLMCIGPGVTTAARADDAPAATDRQFANAPQAIPGEQPIITDAESPPPSQMTATEVVPKKVITVSITCY